MKTSEITINVPIILKRDDVVAIGGEVYTTIRNYLEKNNPELYNIIKYDPQILIRTYNQILQEIIF